MTRYRCIVEVQSPVAISLRRATGHSLETRGYIPGTALRGALAQAFLDGGGEAKDPEFQALFLERKVRIGDQRPRGEKPWPASTRECADKPGRSEHSPLDLLLQKGAGSTIAMDCTFHGQEPNKRCGAKRRVMEGFYQPIGDSYGSVRVMKRRIAHTQIQPQFQRAMSGQFHASTVLSEGASLEGFVWAKDDATTFLEELLKQERVLYLGRGRTRGQGRVKVQLMKEPAESAEETQGRIRDFNEEAQKIYAHFRDKVVFSCSLLSGAILLDDWLMARAKLEGADLGEVLSEYQPLARFLRTEAVSGWNAGAGYPRGEVTMLAPGSCFLFGQTVADAGREAEYGRIAAALVAAEEQGLGERREEGFGEIAFCEPIHWKRAAREGQ